ncbi:hypothetical protein ACFWUZ_17730 [Streptomyces sp. NPDC058646]|uniref:hypothetical protein n=1 Tax=Streptomyces sp. NPDC058646 TaxID=3346574 RepID=UPI00365CD992
MGLGCRTRQASILVSTTYGWLIASSDTHGFTCRLFPTMIVVCNLGAFCVTPYALVRGTIGCG